jgi:transcriptional regulator with XRE-family HTH domain
MIRHPYGGVVNDAQVGSVIRAIRLRRGLSQSELGAAAGVSRSVVSAIERGGLDGSPLRVVRRVSSALGVSLVVEPGWRGAQLAKLLDERHAAMVQNVVARLAALGWQSYPEHTFSVWGERGVYDVLSWHPARRALLSIEIKTRLPDLQDLLSTMDRKGRLAPKMADELGLRPRVFASVLVLPEETWARNAIGNFGPVFAAALPARTTEVRRWIHQPERDLRGIWFLLNDARGSVKQRPGGSMRVRRRVAVVQTPVPRSEVAPTPPPPPRRAIR